MCKNKCVTKGCRNRKSRGSYCYKCISRKYRELHKERAAYQHLKDNAKRRGHAFDLSFEDFKIFCSETKYIAGKGRVKTALSIDRIDPAKGYTIDNLQVMSVSENSSKSNRLVYDIRTKTATIITVNLNVGNVNNIF